MSKNYDLEYIDHDHFNGAALTTNTEDEQIELAMKYLPFGKTH